MFMKFFVKKDILKRTNHYSYNIWHQIFNCNNFCFQVQISVHYKTAFPKDVFFPFDLKHLRLSFLVMYDYIFALTRVGTTYMAPFYQHANNIEGYEGKIKVCHKHINTSSFWLKIIYFNRRIVPLYKLPRHHVPRSMSCSNRYQSSGKPPFYCWNHSSLVLDYSQYFVHLVFHTDPRLHRQNRKVSWNEASDLCKTPGGYLPVARTSEEVSLIVTFVHYVSVTNPSELIFLGINRDQVRTDCLLIKILCCLLKHPMISIAFISACEIDGSSELRFPCCVSIPSNVF